MKWYFGAGIQAIFQSYTYAYRYQIYKGDNWMYSDGDKTTNNDIGIDGVIGLEYTFPNHPISAFIDATAFLELIDEPFKLYMQGCVGVRYNF